MSLFTAVNGAVKKLIRWPSGYAGSVKEKDGIYAGVNGSLRRIFSRYRWKRYAVITNTVEYIKRGATGKTYAGWKDRIWLYSEVEIQNGKIVGKGDDEIFYLHDGDSFPYRKNGIDYKYEESSSGAYENFGTIRLRYPNSDNDYDIVFDYYKLSVATREEYSQGSFIDEVSSDDASAFPENGVQDGYWYVKI